MRSKIKRLELKRLAPSVMKKKKSGCINSVARKSALFAKHASLSTSKIRSRTTTLTSSVRIVTG